MATRKRKAVVTEETKTTTTVRRRRRVALTEETATQPWPVIERAAGWDGDHGLLSGAELRSQRNGQVGLAVQRLWAGASDPAGDDGQTVRAAVAILRAGPGASPLELLYGRYT
jgi:hypothetical protein